MSQFAKGQASSSNNDNSGGGADDSSEDGVKRRLLRSRYLAVKNLISDERDDISRVDSDKFNSIINEVESLHQLVQKPREQVADAEALLDITSTLMTSVKAHCNEGITPSEYIACLIRDFGQQGEASIDWKKIGLDVPHAFKRAPGCCTMCVTELFHALFSRLGPMNVEIKQRAVATRKKHVRPTESSRPEELDESAEERIETDKNIATMFNILRKNMRVRLERIVLNRDSFAETVENIFALSFLVKDGRAEITVVEKGCHIVSPKNAHVANVVASREVSYSHFIFRFDFKDWKGNSSSGNLNLQGPNRLMSGALQQVHGEPLLGVIRVCYTIALNRRKLHMLLIRDDDEEGLQKRSLLTRSLSLLSKILAAQ